MKKSMMLYGFLNSTPMFMPVVGLFALVLCFQNCSDFNALDEASRSYVIGEINGPVMTPAETMAKMKSAACNADGFLNSTGPDAADTVSMMARSSCYFLPRAVELWMTVPNFSLIQQQVASLKAQAPASQSFLLGVFLPEAIPSTVYSITGVDGSTQTFNFADFCLPNSQGYWGMGSCKPDLTNTAYQNYLLYLVDQMTSIGITTFQFGQIGYMDPTSSSNVYSLMRQRAVADGIPNIFISGQLVSSNAQYLANFDFIVGGSYLSRFGTVQVNGTISGPGAQAQGSALVWALEYRSIAQNVFVELDWWNTDDDIHRFGEMSSSDRQRVIQSLYNYYASLGVAFVLPFSEPLNGGVTIASACHGVSQYVYSASKSYSCDDEGALNQIINQGPIPSSGQSGALNSIILKPGDSIQNLSGADDTLLMQQDGNLVVYNASESPLWSAFATSQTCQGCYAALQPDGNTVLYSDNAAYWATGTGGNLGAQLALSTTAPYLSVVAPNQNILWTSATSVAPLSAPVVAPVAAAPVAVPAAIAAPVATTVASTSVATALTPVIPGNVIGNIDGVVANGDGSYSVSGWACAQGSSNSINVALYLNAPAGQAGALGIGWFLASNASEPAVASACQSTGAAYRFSIPLSVAFIQQYGGDSIYIHGISPFGLGNNLLAGSGNFKVPAPPPPVVVPTSQVFYGNGLDLYQDQSIVLPNLTLLQQGDGNLVLSSNGTVLWSAGFSGYNCYATPCHAIFQGDGNFVIYQGSNVLWAAGSNGGTSLVFQESSPHIVIYNSSNQVVWSDGN